MKLIILLILTFTFGGPVIFSQTTSSTKEDRKNVSITIYNMGLGVVREERLIKLPKGISSLIFQDVAQQIIPQSVRVSSEKGKLTVFEQNYEYDLVTNNRLMDKFIGKEVTIYNTHPEHGAQIPVKATLISNNSGPVFQVGNEISLGYPGRITIPNLPENLYAKPTMIWKLSNESGGDIPLSVMYQTNGMTWEADYVMVLSENEKTAGINCWVTLHNTSGTEFKQATLQLVAGDVKRYQVNQQFRGGRQPEIGMMAKMAEAPSFEQENLSEFYLYTLDTPTDLNDNQTKQLQLFTANNIQMTKRFVVENLPMYQQGEVNFSKAAVKYEFKNSTANQLGRPLPKGTFRIYKSDSKGRQQLLGEDGIQHTPLNEMVVLHSGDAFDVVASGKELSMEYFDAGKGYRATYEVSLRNRKSEAVSIRYYANIYGGNWKILKSSHNFIKESNFKTYSEISVGADKEVIVTYTLEVKY